MTITVRPTITRSSASWTRCSLSASNALYQQKTGYWYSLMHQWCNNCVFAIMSLWWTQCLRVQSILVINYYVLLYATHVSVKPDWQHCNVQQRDAPYYTATVKCLKSHTEHVGDWRPLKTVHIDWAGIKCYLLAMRNVIVFYSFSCIRHVLCVCSLYIFSFYYVPRVPSDITNN